MKLARLAAISIALILLLAGVQGPGPVSARTSTDSFSTRVPAGTRNATRQPTRPVPPPDSRGLMAASLTAAKDRPPPGQSGRRLGLRPLPATGSVTATANDVPTLVSPADNDVVWGVRPTLKGIVSNPTAGATYKYQFSVCDTDGVFDPDTCTPDDMDMVVTSPALTTPEWTVPAGLLYWNTSYAWSMRVLSSKACCWTPSSPFRTFWTVVPLGSGSNYGRAPHAIHIKGVNLATGQLLTTSSDAKVAVTGPSLELVRHYSSGDARLGAFGTGWSSVLDMKVVAGAGDAGPVVRYADGREERFGTNPNGTFSPGPGNSGNRLTKCGSCANFTLLDSSGTSYELSTSGLVRISDRNGSATTVARDAGGRITRLTDDKSGRRLDFTWSGARVSSVAAMPAPAGVDTTWTYIYSGNLLTKVCDPRGAVGCTTYLYASAEFPTRITGAKSPMGRQVLDVVYERNGKVESLIADASTSLRWRFVRQSIANGARVSVTNPRGAIDTYELDSSGRLVKLIDAVGAVQSWEFGHDGLLRRYVNAVGSLLELGYDRQRNLVMRKTWRDENTAIEQRYEYLTGEALPQQLSGKLSVVSDPRTGNARYRFEYDNSGRLTKRHDHPSTFEYPISEYTYTTGAENAHGGAGFMPAGLLKKIAEPGGAVRHNAYDAKGDLRETIDPSGLRTVFDYDALGRLVALTEFTQDKPAGARQDFEYDSAGRLLAIVQPAIADATSGVTRKLRMTSGYNTDGDLIAQTITDVLSGSEQRWSYEVDGAGRVLAVRGLGGEIEAQTTYDSVGNVESRTDSNGHRSRFSYTLRDELNTITAVGYSDPVKPAPPRDIVLQSNIYDPAGHLASRHDAIGQRWEFEYYLDDLPKTATAKASSLPGGLTEDLALHRYKYDAAGNVVEDVSAGGERVDSFVYGGHMKVTEHYIKVGGATAADRYHGYTYNLAGLVKESRDEGGVKRLAYDGSGRVVRVDLLGKNESMEERVESSIRVQRNEKGLIRSIVEPRAPSENDPNWRTDYEYDAAGNLTSWTGPAVPTVTPDGIVNLRPTARRGYDRFGRLSVEVTPDGDSESRRYDLRGRLVAVDLPTVVAGGVPVRPTFQYAYDASGRLTQVTRPDTSVTKTTYDSLGRVVALDGSPLEPGGTEPRRWTAEYDDLGRVVRSADPMGGAEEFVYDSLGRLTSRTRVGVGGAPPRRTVGYRYDKAGNLVEQQAPSGAKTRYSFNAAAEPIGVEDADGVKASYFRDEHGRVFADVDGLGRIRQSFLNAWGKPTKTFEVTRDGRMALIDERRYDAAGDEIERIDALGNPRSWAYDALGRVTRAAEADGTQTSMAYDMSGSLSRVTDARGHTTEIEHNAWGLPEKVVEPVTVQHGAVADRTWSWSYNILGLATRITEPGGITIDRSFDADGNVLHETGNGPGVATAERRMTYDRLGRLTSFSHPGGTQSLNYDDFGSIVASSGPAGAASFAYDVDGRLTSRTDAAGSTTNGWTSAGRLSALTPGGGARPSTLSYDLAGQLVRQRWSDGTVREYSYDERRRLAVDQIADASGGLKLRRTYAYDDAGRRTSTNVEPATVANNGRTQYEYDKRSRLAGWVEPEGTRHNLAWDAANNLVGRDGTSLMYDARNRLTQDGPTTYSYLANGARSGQFSSSGETRMSYDALGRMTASGSETYLYDALDRIAVASGTNVRYAGLERDPTSVGGAAWTREPAGSVVAGGSTTIISDIHGDVVAGMSTSGTLTTRGFSPFGKPIADGSEPLGPLGFQGDWTSPSGAVHMHARWYDPNSGTFLARDKAAVGIHEQNRYAYAMASPVNASDPTGRLCGTPYTAPICIGAAIGAGGTSWSGPGAVGGAVVGGLIGAAVGGAAALCAWKCESSGMSPGESAGPSVGFPQLSMPVDLGGMYGDVAIQNQLTDQLAAQLGPWQGAIAGANSGISQSNVGVAHATAGIGQANFGIGQANAGISQANAGIAGAIAGINQMNAGLSIATTAISQALVGVNEMLAGQAQTLSGINQMLAGQAQMLSGINQLIAAVGQMNAAVNVMIGGITQMISGVNIMLAGLTIMADAAHYMFSDTRTNVLKLGPGAWLSRSPVGVVDARVICDAGQSSGCQAALTRVGPACAARSTDLRTACVPAMPQPDKRGDVAAPALATGGGGGVIDPPKQSAIMDPCDPSRGPPSADCGEGRGWSVGDRIDKLTKTGTNPSWSAVRARYWKNAAADALDGEYSDANLARMSGGRAPKHDTINVSKELNHITPRHLGGGNNIENLEEVWPWEHAAVDPFRHYTGPTP